MRRRAVVRFLRSRLVPLRFYHYYGNAREAYCGSTFSPEASLEQAGSKLICRICRQ